VWLGLVVGCRTTGGRAASLRAISRDLTTACGWVLGSDDDGVRRVAGFSSRVPDHPPVIEPVEILGPDHSWSSSELASAQSRPHHRAGLRSWSATTGTPRGWVRWPGSGPQVVEQRACERSVETTSPEGVVRFFGSDDGYRVAGFGDRVPDHRWSSSELASDQSRPHHGAGLGSWRRRERELVVGFRGRVQPLDRPERILGKVSGSPYR